MVVLYNFKNVQGLTPSLTLYFYLLGNLNYLIAYSLYLFLQEDLFPQLTRFLRKKYIFGGCKSLVDKLACEVTSSVQSSVNSIQCFFITKSFSICILNIFYIVFMISITRLSSKNFFSFQSSTLYSSLIRRTLQYEIM